MIDCRKIFCLALGSIGCLFACESFGQIRLPALIRDSMVLQRETKINIWGWAKSKEKISINFNHKTYKATTSTNGKWAIELPPMKAGGPYAMEISGSNKLLLSEILIGDVWVCSGQSNMVHQMELHNITYANEIATANYSNIRQFWIPTMFDLTGPKDNFPTGYWKSAVNNDIRQFSAVAYFFAKAIFEKYHIPIGLINASVGGTPAEAWTSQQGLKDFSSLQAIIEKYKDTTYVNTNNRTIAALNASKPLPIDKGMSELLTWFDKNYIPSGWKPINVPGYWEDQGIKNLDGIVWYRKVIDIPASMTNKAAKLFMGRIIDADFVYINGIQVGSTTYQYPQRRYQLQPGLIETGENTIVIRVINNNGKGGFVPDKPYMLIAADDTIDLKGEWKYKVGAAFSPGINNNNMINAQNQPTALYNAMIAPLINYTIKGFLWYQGEANTAKPEEYLNLMKALIADWRTQWKNENAPFIYVQLPNFMETNYLPSESQWAQLREAQLKTLAVPNTAMAVAIDLGEWNDIHPDNKKDVGLRLALAAEKIAYGENMVYSGPIYTSSKIEGNKIVLNFTSMGTGLITNDGAALSQFAIASADKKFVWATAKIENNQVIVWNQAVVNPMYVRYAWADNPEGANLYNKEGLPASPFRTDQ